jgi:hypothetical protein
MSLTHQSKGSALTGEFIYLASFHQLSAIFLIVPIRHIAISTFFYNSTSNLLLEGRLSWSHGIAAGLFPNPAVGCHDDIADM